MDDNWLEEIKWSSDGLVPAIAQDADSGKLLMMAWMNREALEETLSTGNVCYYSRSRGTLWRKGESSGHIQHLKSLHLDCDGDTVLLKVEQVGGIACHTGRRHCFFRQLQGNHWRDVEAVIRDPADIYGGEQ